MTTSQQSLPTVGDTFTIVRHIAAPAGAVIEARPPTDTTIATLITAPAITREGDSVRIAYTVAVWAPGHNQLDLPGAIVVSLRGKVDTLPDVVIPLNVASVLPAGKSAAALAPKPAHRWIAGGETSMLPAAVLLPIALVLIALLQWRWRARGRPALVPTQLPPALLTADRVERWLAAGEARLALAHLEWQLRERDDLAEWRARADALRFGAVDSPELDQLVREGWAQVAEERPA
jgi:hypothetical protein